MQPSKKLSSILKLKKIAFKRCDGAMVARQIADLEAASSSLAHSSTGPTFFFSFPFFFFFSFFSFFSRYSNSIDELGYSADPWATLIEPLGARTGSTLHGSELAQGRLSDDQAWLRILINLRLIRTLLRPGSGN
jgi:hypothetical protein